MSFDEEMLVSTQTQTQTQSINSQNSVFGQSLTVPDVWGSLVMTKMCARRLGLKQTIFLQDLGANKNERKEFGLSKATITVGRGAENDISIPDLDVLPKTKKKHISKTHFILQRDVCDPTAPVYIEDRSTNGTFVNDKLIGHGNRRILAHNDSIVVQKPRVIEFVYKSHRTDHHDLPKDILDEYHIGKELGSGAFGIVYVVHDRLSCDSFALKYTKNINKSKATMNETKILKTLRHPCIIQMHAIKSNTESILIVLELMHGGDLTEYIQRNGHLDEQKSKFLFYQMCKGIEYIHSKNVIHRDLKPDNILLATNNDYPLIKITDFGLSKLVEQNRSVRTMCGTKMYLAPEVLASSGAYNSKVDIWSLGVILFNCLTGTYPYSTDCDLPSIIEQVENDQSSQLCTNVSISARILIRKMLTVNATKRLDICSVLSDDWLLQADESVQLAIVTITRAKK